MDYKISLLVFLALITVTFGKRGRIAGGQIVGIRHHPYMVSLRFIDTNDLRCGGAIITHKHVLTAAHCMFEVTCNEMLVYAGSWSSTNVNAPKYELKRFSIHPGYDMASSEMQKNDIAVLTIKGFFVFNALLNKIDLPTADVVGGERVTLPGWGKLFYESPFTSDILRKVEMTVMENHLCWPEFGHIIDDTQVCVLEGTGIGACTGDSGGPLVFNGQVVGIASFVVPCATGVPDIYTRVFRFLNFINSEISSRHPTSCCTCQ